MKSKDIIPKDWIENTLGKVYIEQPKSKLKVGDADNFGNVPFFTSGDAVLSHSTPIIEGENIFLATGGSANVKYYDGKSAYSTDTYAIVGKNINTLYLYYLLLNNISIINQNYFSGSGLKHLQKNDFKEIVFSLPTSLTEQKQIADILSTADKAIEDTQALIDKYKSIKDGLMHDLLKPKIGWKKVELGKCLKQKPDYGINAPAVAYESKLPTYLRITDITEDGYYSKKNIVSVADSNAYKFILNEGDIVFARTGASVGKTYLYDHNDGLLVFAGFLIRVKVDEHILLPKFLKYQTQTNEYKNWISINSIRSGQPGINSNEYEKFSFYIPFKNGVPDIKEQLRISEILSSIDILIRNLETSFDKQKRQSIGLINDLIKGKVRVNILLKDK